MVESKMYDHRIDIWSLGVIMFELLVGKTPFDDPSVNNIYRKIKEVDYTIPDTVSRSANDLIKNVYFLFIYLFINYIIIYLFYFILFYFIILLNKEN